MSLCVFAFIFHSCYFIFASKKDECNNNNNNKLGMI